MCCDATSVLQMHSNRAIQRLADNIISKSTIVTITKPALRKLLHIHFHTLPRCGSKFSCSRVKRERYYRVVQNIRVHEIVQNNCAQVLKLLRVGLRGIK